MTKYPTKEEIIAKTKQIKFNPGIIEETKKWKRKYLKNWKKNSNPTKIRQLSLLLLILAEIEYHANPKIPKNILEFNFNHQYQYDPETHTIYHDVNKPSVISSLHELAHHFYGSDELQACAWSTHLFMTCFPGSYEQLEWKGHLLVKK